MMELVFATGNLHKLTEVKAMFANTDFKILGFKDIGFQQEIVEDGQTFEENAIIKVNTVFDFCQIPCFADDSGIETFALDGRPGIYSARYAGPNCTSEDNNNKLLSELKSFENRRAQFTAVIAYRDNKVLRTFEGKIKGDILKKPKSQGGFGYDPIFRPLGYLQSFAELGSDEKNQISHRGRSVRQLIDYLQKEKG